ncbi:hypothetical protein HPP92_025712 [Vanilla planifolia]|uniref:Uncharacterized protein n=1 Tax=Vanilla planifolia TaxID=51239 RepID=A0A835PKJ2_VANPL|nr:hypothetical protein HPP92_025712 [Vanilla planifolia]
MKSTSSPLSQIRIPQLDDGSRAPWFEYAIVQSPRLSSTPRWSAVAKTQELAEIRVCVNRSCGKLGSRATLEVLSGIAPQGVAVSSCGCLGRCGAGPNLFVLPGGAIFGHCSTPARAAQLLSGICGSDFDPWRNLEALSLKKMGEEELEKGNPHSAVELLTKAIELIPSGGLHMLYKTRSLARLRRGDNEGAFEDAKEACEMAPGFPQAYICKGDALLAMGDLHAAEMAYSTALSVDPSIRRSNSFKTGIAKLQEMLRVTCTS